MSHILDSCLDDIKESLSYLTMSLEHIDFSSHRLFDIKHMVIEIYFFRGNSLSTYRLLSPISSSGFFYMHFPRDRTKHTKVFNEPDVDHWLARKIAQTANASAVQDRSDDLRIHRWVLHCLSYVPFQTSR